MYSIDVGLGGLFAFAAVHYALQWWFSREEKVLLAFSAVCALYTAFTLSMSSRHSVTTIAESQLVLDRSITIAMLAHAAQVQLYAYLAKRRDHVFRALLCGACIIAAVLNLWVPLRGTVLALQPIPMPGGGTGLMPIRTGPGVLLALMYLAGLMVVTYGFVGARTIWKRDRWGALLVRPRSVRELGRMGDRCPDRFRPFAGTLRRCVADRIPRAVHGVLSRARVLGACRAGGRRRSAIRDRVRARADRQGPARRRTEGAAGSTARSAAFSARAPTSSATTAAGLHAPGRRGADELEARLLAGEIPTYTVEKCIARKTASPPGRCWRCRSSRTSTVGLRASSSSFRT